MILIITHRSDETTVEVCCWLSYQKKEYQILDLDDALEIKKISSQECLIRNVSRDYTLDLNKVKTVFYRQGNLGTFKNLQIAGAEGLMQSFAVKENKIILDFLYEKISRLRHFGHPQNPNSNKLDTLALATEVGLRIPEYIYTSSKTDLLQFHDQHAPIITKTIQPSLTFVINNERSMAYTQSVSLAEINDWEDTFYPTFFQKEIPKRFDLRVFYLNGSFYPMAIFSQKNAQTNLDYRHYDKELPNRQIPFNLGKEVESKLEKMAKYYSFLYCSIDLIYGLDQQLYFLEINPIGQFTGLSYTCNFHLEKKIAALL